MTATNFTSTLETGFKYSDYQELVASIESGLRTIKVESVNVGDNYTLPTTDGSDGYVLKTDGAGTVTWQDASGGSGNAGALIERAVEGEVYTGTLLQIPIPDAYDGLDVTEVRISLTGLPSGQALKVDIRKNGTDTTDSIFTSDTEIEIATSESATNGVYQSGCDTSGSTVGTSGTTIDSGEDTLTADDVLFVVVTQVGSTTSGTDLTIQITVA